MELRTWERIKTLPGWNGLNPSWKISIPSPRGVDLRLSSVQNGNRSGNHCSMWIAKEEFSYRAIYKQRGQIRVNIWNSSPEVIQLTPKAILVNIFCLGSEG